MWSEGILIIDKPSGITSHDVVAQVRRITGVKKTGHAGTLDPLATGVLIVLVGRKATKLSDALRGQDKTYQIQFEIGYQTDTLDSDGEILEKLDPESSQIRSIDEPLINETIRSFAGEYEQEVPRFSAVKVGGEKLYNLARKKSAQLEEIEIPKRLVQIKSIQLDRFQKSDHQYPVVDFTATVSKGTYTRALVRDIGKKLGLPTVQTALRRTRAGEFTIQQAVELANIKPSDLLPR